MAFIETHKDERMVVEFHGSVAGMVGMTSFTGSFADFKRLRKELGKTPAVGDPIELKLYEPPEFETEDE